MSPSQVTLLSPQERLALIEQLWDSLSDSDLTVTPAQQTELDRRIAAREADQDPTVTWAELQRELHRRQGK